MESLKILYAIPNYECNLTCPFCDLRKKHVDYNRDLFLNQINKFDGEIVLFGGEPTLYKKRYFDIIENGKIDSITTNLLDVDDDIINSFKNISLATSLSWGRFNQEQYLKWKNNLEKLKQKNIHCKLLITMSEQLIKEVKPYIMIGILKNLDRYSIDAVAFEQLIDKTKDAEFYDSVDDWLCKLHDFWPTILKMENTIINQIKKGWIFNCENVYTLHPNGEITGGCPQKEEYKIVEKCYTCERNEHCRPCILQRQCTYPHKLADKIK